MLAITFQVTFKECKQTFLIATNLCSSLIVRAKQFVVEALSVSTFSNSLLVFNELVSTFSSIFVTGFSSIFDVLSVLIFSTESSFSMLSWFSLLFISNSDKINFGYVVLFK